MNQGSSMNPRTLALAWGGACENDAHVPTVTLREVYRLMSRVMGAKDVKEELRKMAGAGLVVLEDDTVGDADGGVIPGREETRVLRTQGAARWRRAGERSRIREGGRDAGTAAAVAGRQVATLVETGARRRGGGARASARGQSTLSPSRSRGMRRTASGARSAVGRRMGKWYGLHMIGVPPRGEGNQFIRGLAGTAQGGLAEKDCNRGAAER